MRLKRHYKRLVDRDGAIILDEQGAIQLEHDAAGRAVLDYVEIQHTGTTPNQNFSDTLVLAGLREGWLSIADGVLTLRGKPEDLTYKILRTPGKYADDSPAGYQVIHAFECVLEADQHARFCVAAKRAQSGQVSE